MDKPKKHVFFDESYLPLARGDSLFGLAFMVFSFGVVLATSDATPVPCKNLIPAISLYKAEDSLPRIESHLTL